MTEERSALPPLAANEVSTLQAFLELHRGTLRRKASGLTRDQLAQALPPSTMTLGGLLKHLSVVESSWFEEIFAGGSLMPPFDTVDWDADRDWEWHTARLDEPEGLLALFDDAVARSRRVVLHALDSAGLDQLSVGSSGHGEHVSLCWLLLHMLEEYARHNGHADLLREAVDGSTGT